jgi:hypothetical protein
MLIKILPLKLFVDSQSFCVGLRDLSLADKFLLLILICLPLILKLLLGLLLSLLLLLLLILCHSASPGSRRTPPASGVVFRISCSGPGTEDGSSENAAKKLSRFVLNLNRHGAVRGLLIFGLTSQ